MSAAKPEQPRLRLRRIASIALLTLTACLTALWVHSLWWRPYFSRQAALPAFAHEEFFFTSSHSGRYYFCYAYRDEPAQSRLLPPPQAHWRFGCERYSSAPTRYGGPALLARVGLDGFCRFEQIPVAKGLVTIREVYFTVPYWLPIVVFGTTGWFIGGKPRIVRRRLRRGLCLACGYDTRESPQRCPECGLAAGEGQRLPSASAAS